MKKLNDKIKLLFFTSLALSVGFPLGILGIVFGATGKNWFLLTVGIIFTVLGFYLMPILWVRYGERRGDRVILSMIEEDYLYTVKDLSAQSRYDEENIRARINRMILERTLTGYIFRDDTLICNANIRQTKQQVNTKTCPKCGAAMKFDGVKFFCEYCNHTTE